MRSTRGCAASSADASSNAEHDVRNMLPLSTSVQHACGIRAHEMQRVVSENLLTNRGQTALGLYSAGSLTALTSTFAAIRSCRRSDEPSDPPSRQIAVDEGSVRQDG
jgi:hypothetical protein